MAKEAKRSAAQIASRSLLALSLNNGRDQAAIRASDESIRLTLFREPLEDCLAGTVVAERRLTAVWKTSALLCERELIPAGKLPGTGIRVVT